MPGVMLISPPAPRHLFHRRSGAAHLRLEKRDRDARISVKLVAGRAWERWRPACKGPRRHGAHQRHDGGTGASPLSSISTREFPGKSGLPKRDRLAVRNRLRGFIRVQCDGQMKTGRDVVIAALLGAEEIRFRNGAVVTLGCIMMRKWSSQYLPGGVATQGPRAAQASSRATGIRYQLHAVCGAGSAAIHGAAPDSKPWTR